MWPSSAKRSRRRHLLAHDSGVARQRPGTCKKTLGVNATKIAGTFKKHKQKKHWALAHAKRHLAHAKRNYVESKEALRAKRGTSREKWPRAWPTDPGPAQHYIMLNHTALHYITSRDIASRHVTSRRIMSCQFTYGNLVTTSPSSK